MKRCQQCESVSYCSRQCQEWDWKVGGHREVCGHDNGVGGAGLPNGTGGDDDDVVEVKDLN